MAFADKSTTAIRGTGFRIATKRNKRRWGGYQGPGVDAGGVFGAGHMTGQESRPAPWLPVLEENSETDQHIRQYPIVMYAGTVVGLEADGLDNVSGGDTLNSTTAGGVDEFQLVPANGGQDSYAEVAYAQRDVDNGVRTKGASVQATVVTSGAAAPLIKANRPVGVLMKDAYQNTTNVYQNFELQGEGVSCLLRGWAHYPYSRRNQVGSDASWAHLLSFDSANSGRLDASSADSGVTILLAGVGKIIKEGPLARDITVAMGVNASEVTVTHQINWEATRAAAANAIVMQVAPASAASILVTAWTWSGAYVASVNTTTHVITLDDTNFIGTDLASSDDVVDEWGNTYNVTAYDSTANTITVTDPTWTSTTAAVNAQTAVQVVAGTRLTVWSDGGTVIGQYGAGANIAAGDYVQSGHQGRLVRWDARTDDPAQKVGRAFFVEPTSSTGSTYSRNAGYRPQVPTSFDLVGSGTGGLPAHIFDEFGDAPLTSRGVWVCFDVK